MQLIQEISSRLFCDEDSGARGKGTTSKIGSQVPLAQPHLSVLQVLMTVVALIEHHGALQDYSVNSLRILGRNQCGFVRQLLILEFLGVIGGAIFA